MKVSSILVINVINNLQGKVISRNIFSLNTKVLSILVVFVTKNLPVKIIQIHMSNQFMGGKVSL